MLKIHANGPPQANFLGILAQNPKNPPLVKDQIDPKGGGSLLELPLIIKTQINQRNSLS